MEIRAKLFTTWRSQAVRLPKALRFNGTEVIARAFGNGVLLLPVEPSASLLREALNGFEPGFVLERAQPMAQTRAWGKKSV